MLMLDPDLFSVLILYGVSFVTSTSENVSQLVW